MSCGKVFSLRSLKVYNCTNKSPSAVQSQNPVKRYVSIDYGSAFSASKAW